MGLWSPETAVLNLDSSEINASNVNFNPPFVLNAGTSTINLTSTFFNGNNYTYFNLNINPTTAGSLVSFMGTNTFNILSFGTNVSSINFTSGTTQTIAGIQIASSCNNYVNIGTTSTAPATLLMYTGYVDIDNLAVQNIIIAGGAVFVSDNSLNLGNVVNWTINAPVTHDYFWIGGTGNWNDPNHWSLSSGGTATTCTPNGMDNANFDANSFNAAGQTVTLNVNAFCKNMNWSKAKNNPTLKSVGSAAIYIFGTLTLTAAMNYSYTGNITFSSGAAGNNITTAGKSIGNFVYLQRGGKLAGKGHR